MDHALMHPGLVVRSDVLQPLLDAVLGKLNGLMASFAYEVPSQCRHIRSLRLMANEAARMPRATTRPHDESAWMLMP